MSVVCLGELIVDLFVEDHTASLDKAVHFKRFPGGAPANVAVGLHHHGVPVTLISRVGNDASGDFLIHFLKAKGLSTEGISRDARHRTKIALVGRDAKGDRFFEFHNMKSADQYISITDIPKNIWDSVRIFHIGGVALLGETTALTTIHLLQTLPEDIVVSFDPNIRLELVGNAEIVRMRLQKMLEYVDILKCSDVDFAALFGRKEARNFLENPEKITLLSRGAASTYVHCCGTRVEVPVAPVQAVDTTGAGDAFMAALLARVHAWLQEHSLRDATLEEWKQWVEWANSWGTRCVQVQGALGCYEKTQ